MYIVRINADRYIDRYSRGDGRDDNRHFIKFKESEGHYIHPLAFVENNFACTPPPLCASFCLLKIEPSTFFDLLLRELAHTFGCRCCPHLVTLGLQCRT